MRGLLSVLVLAVCLNGHAETRASKNASFSVPGVGRVRIQFDEVGEPISQPERVEVFVTCDGAKSSFRAAVFRMCNYDGYTYESGTKVITIKMFYGRVEPKTGDVVCDQFDMKEVELASFCRTGQR